MLLQLSLLVLTHLPVYKGLLKMGTSILSRVVVYKRLLSRVVVYKILLSRVVVYKRLLSILSRVGDY